MKYLITAKPGTTPIPREEWVDLLQVALEWTKVKLSDGTLDFAYNIIGGDGFGIGNAKSHEEILALLLEYPLYPYFGWEVKPILSMEENLKQYIEFYKRMESP